VTEIERKFLVDEAPGDVASFPSQELRQGYLAIDPDGTEVRVRHSADGAVLTIKQGSGRVRAEEEFPIDAERFERLWELTAGRRVHKRRHEIPGNEGVTIELDTYAGELEGLIVAEVEFADDQQAATFDAPPWFGREVTDDPRYKNQALAREGIPD
jgi:CYTH domain-containing protein